MSAQPGVWGIDIGQCALKAIRLQMIDNKVTATAFDYVEHAKILSQPDADPDALTREALEKFLSRNPIKGDTVAISVPGQSGLARFVKLPPVEEKKIGDIVKFEAKQQIPFPLDEVVWDFQKVSEGVVEGGFAIDTEIGLFAMKRDMINRYLNHFGGVKVEVHTVQMAPLALCNYITYDFLKRGGPDGITEAPVTVGKKKCYVALDIGTDNSSLIITDGGKIIWQRPIPLGGNHFTRALTKELKLTFAKAEHLKRNAAKSPELANILKALKPVLTDFVGEVQRSLGYFTNTHRDAHIEAMVGLGSAFKLPGLQKYLGDKLQLKIEKPAKFLRVVGDAVTASPVFMENILTFPVAYGLALQGLKVARIGTNLLPPEITFDRQIRAKKPWAVAAAASLLLGTAVMAFGFSVPYAAVNDEKIKESIKKGQDVVKEAAKVDSDINSSKGDVAKTAKQVTQIVAGKQERPNWVKINEYVNFAVPTLPSPKYWYLVDPKAYPPPKDAVKFGLNDYLEGRATPELGMGNMMYNRDVYLLWARTDRDANGASPWLATQKYFNRINLPENGGIPLSDWWSATPKFAKKINSGEGDPVKNLVEDDMRQYLATVDIETVHSRFTPNLKTFYETLDKERLKVVGLKLDEAMDPVEAKNLPEGKGWVFEVRGTSWYRYNNGNVSLDAKNLLEMTFVPNLRALAKDDKAPVPEVKDGKKSGAPSKSGGDPIRGKVSHILLYNVWKDETPRNDTFNWIDRSTIDSLMGGGGAQGQGGVPPTGPMGMKPTPNTGAATGGGAWTPLGSSTLGSGGGARNVNNQGGTTVKPGLGKGTDTPKEDPKKDSPKVKPRYEFVIIFAWREDTPSDEYMPAPPKPAADTTTTPGKAMPTPGGGAPVVAPPTTAGGKGGAIDE